MCRKTSLLNTDAGVSGGSSGEKGWAVLHKTRNSVSCTKVGTGEGRHGLSLEESDGAGSPLCTSSPSPCTNDKLVK